MNPLTPLQKSIDPAIFPREAPETLRVGLIASPPVRDLPPTVVPLTPVPGRVPATRRNIGTVQPGGRSSRAGVKTLKVRATE